MNGRDAQGEAYLDIVWRQFKKHRSAYISLWLLAPVFLIAILAPAIASNRPLVRYQHREGGLTLGFSRPIEWPDRRGLSLPLSYSLSR